MQCLTYDSRRSFAPRLRPAGDLFAGKPGVAWIHRIPEAGARG